jgi:phosphopantothenoylcysteine decarboxylase / phosphopantothenate---cysteine ligase
MSDLKHIILGISGGIAAYKIPSLIRLFRKTGVQVKVVCTKSALEFVTPLTLETLSGEKIYCDVFGQTEEYTTGHISITDKADALIVAPATANILAKYAAGIADDALSTTLISFNKPVFLAPAMNTKMWNHEATQNSIQILKSRGVHFIDPESGFLACGYDGEGRMAEPEVIFNSVTQHFTHDSRLAGKKVLVTAGPTHEAIDPVRFISNNSSGKMGYALAEAFRKKGAEVTLISGPVNIKSPHPAIKLIRVTSAMQMHEACIQEFPSSQITVMAAAVADYAPSDTSGFKIKKTEKTLTLRLTQTPDILSHMGQKKAKNQILVGFALETHNETENALKKLHNKHLDCIVLNSLQDEGSGFEFDTNKVTIITEKKQLSLPLQLKTKLAGDIVSFIAEHLIKTNSR